MLHTDTVPTAKRTRFKPAAGITEKNVQAAIETLAEYEAGVGGITVVEVRTDDPPNPIEGQMWFRSDL